MFYLYFYSSEYLFSRWWKTHVNFYIVKLWEYKLFFFRSNLIKKPEWPFTNTVILFSYYTTHFSAVFFYIILSFNRIIIDSIFKKYASFSIKFHTILIYKCTFIKFLHTYLHTHMYIVHFILIFFVKNTKIIVYTWNKQC